MGIMCIKTYIAKLSIQPIIHGFVVAYLFKYEDVA